MERLIDPAIADLQSEHAQAARAGRTWRGRWIRVAGTLAFWKVMGLHAAARVGPITREWARGLSLDLHTRLALACSPAILGLFAFSIAAAARQRSRAIGAGLAAIAAYYSCFWILPAPIPALAAYIPAALAAWTPNLIFAAATARILRSPNP
jgi:lipopolysaccharide export LptBFGC system permease protein LptF